MNTRNTLKHLEAIRDATEEILKEAQGHKHKIDGPINWADLHCYESRYVMTDGGDEYFEVIIREADHSNQQLCDFVKEKLVSKYDYHLVYPVFEW